MRADAFLAAAAALPVVDFDTIAKGRGLLIIAPHPDDESLGCGGLIAEACARGVSVRVVIVSDGVGSHPNSLDYPPERLRSLREGETRDAAQCLGLGSESIEFLRLPDRFVPSVGPVAAAARDRIRGIASEAQSGTVLVTWSHDPHCDHAAAAAIARLVPDHAGRPIRLFEYPVWGWSLPPATDVGGPPFGFRLDTSQHVEAKRSAIAAHRSQTTGLITDDPTGFRLEAKMIEQFLGPYEIYLEVEK